VVLALAGIQPLRTRALWRCYALLTAYTLALGAFDGVVGANYMYLCRKPRNPSLLDWPGPWPTYLAATAGVGFILFWLLWLPLRPRVTISRQAGS
jgi:uncharacterized membrane protein YwaF